MVVVHVPNNMLCVCVNFYAFRKYCKDATIEEAINEKATVFYIQIGESYTYF